MKIAIVGYGGMASYHLNRIKKVKGISVKGAFDIDSERQKKAVEDGIIAYSTYQEIANDAEIGAVLIATPNDVHAFYIEYFAKVGKRIFCEKPVVNSQKEFKRTLKKIGNAPLLVNQNRRYDKDYLIAKKITQQGNIGKIYRIESRVTGANGVPGGWRKELKKGGGMMLDWGVHLIDQVCLMFDKFKSLSCTYSYALGFDVEDGFYLTLNTYDNVEIIIEVQTNNYITSDRWRIYGRDGSAVIRNWDCEGEIVTPIYNSESEIVSISAGNGLTKTMAYRAHNSVERSPLFEVEFDADSIYKNLAQAKDESQLIVKRTQVERVLKIMDKCKLSAKRGGALINIYE